jgi:2,3-bisphosphoglycerate-dependent phosphoglycerate mutase
MKHDTTNTKPDLPLHYTTDKSIPVGLIRHAQSQWNKENRFTGWADPPLTDAGITEAMQAGDKLRIHGYRFDRAYSSRLQRASHTLAILLEQIGQADLQYQQDRRLNERHYGALQGMDKAGAVARVGEKQVWRWRRGYLDRAAALSRDDVRHPIHDMRYAEVEPLLLPNVENLAETRLRVMAFWYEHILSHIQQGERILISAHGNSLRALLMDLAGMSIAEVEAFEIPTAMPIIFNFDSSGRPLQWYYLDAGGEVTKSA